MAISLILGVSLLFLNAATLIGVLWACHQKIEKPPFRLSEDVRMEPDETLRGGSEAQIPGSTTRHYEGQFHKPFVANHQTKDYFENTKDNVAVYSKKEKKMHLNALRKEYLASQISESNEQTPEDEEDIDKHNL